jgi:hypothetical protein
MTGWVLIALGLLVMTISIGIWWIEKPFRRWKRDRLRAECRASNGEYLPCLEREYYDLPDWTGK